MIKIFRYECMICGLVIRETNHNEESDEMVEVQLEETICIPCRNAIRNHCGITIRNGPTNPVLDQGDDG